MGRRAVIVTSVPKNRDRIRRATTGENLSVGTIEAAIESYLQTSNSDHDTTRPKR